MSALSREHGVDELGAEGVVVRVFVSSPKDVGAERVAIARAARTVNKRYEGRAVVELVLWEENTFNAESDFQSQIEDPTRCDALVAILWSRYGSPLQGGQADPGDRPAYRSGTSFEIDTALSARAADVYIYRKSETIFATLDDSAALDEAREQYANLRAYLDRLTRTVDGANKRAINQFGTTEEFEHGARRLLETLVQRKLARRMPLIWDPTSNQSPFPGLAAYGVEDGDLFFGRSRRADLALDALLEAQARRRGFLLIVGPSGSGKSSLMRAGLAPRLMADSLVSGIDSWRVAAMRPRDGASPFFALAKAILAEAPVATEGRDGRLRAGTEPRPALPELATFAFKDAETLAANWAILGAEIAAAGREQGRQGRSLFDFLDSKPSIAAAVTDPLESALEIAGRSLGQQRGYGRPADVGLLVMLDQMEELFARDGGPSGEAASSDATLAAFAAVLATMIATGRVLVMATFRADLYGRLVNSRPLLALKDAGASYDLAPPGQSELREILTRSAAAFGLSYERDEATGELLDERLLEEAQGENALPLLQYTLDQLYKKRTVSADAVTLSFAAYHALGGVEGAIDARAEEAMAIAREAIGVRADEALTSLIRSLVGWVQTEADGVGAVVARPRRLDRRTAQPDLLTVIDALIAARILVATGDRKDGNALERDGAEGEFAADDRKPLVATIRIAHERVLDAWAAAAEIKRKGRAAIEARDRLLAQFREWSLSGRSNDRLIPPGAKLLEALAHLADPINEVEPELRAFVESSDRAARQDRMRRRRMRVWLQTAAAVAFVTGLGMVAAGWSAYENGRAAQSNAELARTNYVGARDVVGGLVSEFTGGLADVQGLPVRTIDRVLGSVAPLIDALARRGSGDLELKRISGAMHHQFANLYREIDLTKAQEQAEKSYSTRRDLFATDRDNRVFAHDMAESWELQGDLERKRPAVIGAAEIAERIRRAYQASFDIRKSVYDKHQADPPSRHGLSLSLIRLGDLLAEPDAALEKYQEAQAVMAPALEAEPVNPKYLRESSWIARKIGDVHLLRARAHAAAGRDVGSELDLAHRQQVKGLCERRVLVRFDPTSVLAKRDLAYSLQSLGNVAQARKDEEGALAARFEDVHERRRLAEDNRGNPGLTRELAQSLVNLIGTLRHFEEGDEARYIQYLIEARAVLDRLASLESEAAFSGRRLSAEIDVLIKRSVPEGPSREGAIRASEFVTISLEARFARLRPTAIHCPA